MADNVPITAGSGTNIATDDAGAGGHVQIVKLAIATDGSATLIPADATDGMKVNTELAAASALADGEANPTAPRVGSAGLVMEPDATGWYRVRGADNDGMTRVGFAGVIPMLFNGSAMDRARGSAAFGMQVDVVRIQTGPKAGTGTTSQVADTASSATLLSANAARVGVLLTNDSSARLYVRLSAAAASTTNYSFSLAQHETWEDDKYTGEIRGIWATDPGDGGAKVTETTA